MATWLGEYGVNILADIRKNIDSTLN